MELSDTAIYRRCLMCPAIGVRFAAMVVLVLMAPRIAVAAVPNCESAPPYTPAYAPARSPEHPTGDVSIILVHGKVGSQFSSFFEAPRTAFVSRGYTVIIPNMPWSWLWDGTQCQGLNYLADLIAAERARGMRVMLIGHSMGGMHTFIHSSLEGHDLEAMVAIAPGHMLPLSTTVVRETAPSVEQARSMVADGRGDEIADYYTWYGDLQLMRTTAEIYLSYHDLTITPDFNDVLPAVKPPWYLLVGTEDPIFGFYERAKIIDRLPAGAPSEYVITSGDHVTVFDQVPGLVDAWFRSWSSVGEPPRSATATRLLLILHQLLLED